MRTKKDLDRICNMNNIIYVYNIYIYVCNILYVQSRTNKTVRPYFYKYFFKYVSLRTNVINLGYSYLDL